MSGKKDGRKNGGFKGKKTEIYRAIKVKGHCPKCRTTLFPGDTRCRNKNCNAKFESA
jgi:hypothetical protein